MMTTVQSAKADLRNVWNVIDTPIFRVLNEEGDNMENGQVRQLDAKHWLYVDDVDGFSIVADEAVQTWTLTLGEKEVAMGIKLAAFRIGCSESDMDSYYSAAAGEWDASTAEELAEQLVECWQEQEQNI